MQNIGAPAGNGTIDKILVQAQGGTGGHVDRAPAQSSALAGANDVSAPEVNKAVKYDGAGWKSL